MRDQIQHLDFKSNPDAARQIVNGWVASETRDHIKDLIPPSGITAATDLVLANAAYFKVISYNFCFIAHGVFHINNC